MNLKPFSHVSDDVKNNVYFNEYLCIDNTKFDIYLNFNYEKSIYM